MLLSIFSLLVSLRTSLSTPIHGKSAVLTDEDFENGEAMLSSQTKDQEGFDYTMEEVIHEVRNWR